MEICLLEGTDQRTDFLSEQAVHGQVDLSSLGKAVANRRFRIKRIGHVLIQFESFRRGNRHLGGACNNRVGRPIIYCGSFGPQAVRHPKGVGCGRQVPAGVAYDYVNRVDPAVPLAVPFGS